MHLSALCLRSVSNSVLRKHPQIYWRTFIMRIAHSSRLLSKGASKLYINFKTASLCSSSLRSWLRSGVFLTLPSLFFSDFGGGGCTFLCLIFCTNELERWHIKYLACFNSGNFYCREFFVTGFL